MYKRQVPTLTAGTWVRMGHTSGFSYSYSDADGDAAVKFEVKAASKGHGFWARQISHFDAVGGQEVSVSDFQNDFYIKGYSSNLTQTVQIRAHDGKGWGAWTSFKLISSIAANNLPVMKSIADQTLTAGTTKNISSLVSATDADGDAITQYEVKDTTGANSCLLYTSPSPRD